jgi:hypothetical protein
VFPAAEKGLVGAGALGGHVRGGRDLGSCGGPQTCQVKVGKGGRCCLAAGGLAEFFSRLMTRGAGGGGFWSAVRA